MTKRRNKIATNKTSLLLGKKVKKTNSKMQNCENFKKKAKLLNGKMTKWQNNNMANKCI